jgi:hypothetical protein
MGEVLSKRTSRKPYAVTRGLQLNLKLCAACTCTCFEDHAQVGFAQQVAHISDFPPWASSWCILYVNDGLKSHADIMPGYSHISLRFSGWI